MRHCMCLFPVQSCIVTCLEQLIQSGSDEGVECFYEEQKRVVLELLLHPPVWDLFLDT